MSYLAWSHVGGTIVPDHTILVQPNSGGRQPQVIRADGTILIDSTGLIQDSSVGTVGIATKTAGLQEALVSGGHITIAGNLPAFSTNIFLDQNNPLTLAGLDFVQSVINFNGSGWLFTEKSGYSSYGNGNGHQIFRDLKMSLTGTTYLGAVNGTYLDPSFEGNVTIQGDSSRSPNFVGTGILLSPTMNGVETNSSLIKVASLATGMIIARDHVSIDHLLTNNCTTHVQFGESGESTYGVHIGYLHSIDTISGTDTALKLSTPSANVYPAIKLDDVLLEVVSGASYANHFDMPDAIAVSNRGAMQIGNLGILNPTNLYQINAVGQLQALRIMEAQQWAQGAISVPLSQSNNHAGAQLVYTIGYYSPNGGSGALASARQYLALHDLMINISGGATTSVQTLDPTAAVAGNWIGSGIVIVKRGQYFSVAFTSGPGLAVAYI